jgi:hypothetical protein
MFLKKRFSELPLDIPKTLLYENQKFKILMTVKIVVTGGSFYDAVCN